MHLYRPKQDSNNCERLFNVNQDELLVFSDFLKNACFHGSNASWSPIEVEVSSEGKFSDFPAFVGRQLVFSRRAYRVLESLLQGSINPLPLTCSSSEYFGIQIKDVVDCLDYSSAQVSISASGRLTAVQVYAFKEGYIEAIGDKKNFRLPESTIALVSEGFKQCVEDNHLEGLIFEQVA